MKPTESVPILNDGKIYVVTRFPGMTHLGDYRTFAEAIACARAAGAIFDPNREYGTYYNTPDGGYIHIGVELVDPLLR